MYCRGCWERFVSQEVMALLGITVSSWAPCVWYLAWQNVLCCKAVPQPCPYSATSPHPGYRWSVGPIALLNPLTGRDACGAEKDCFHVCMGETGVICIWKAPPAKLEHRREWVLFSHSLHETWQYESRWMSDRQMREQSTRELRVYKNVTAQVCLLEDSIFNDKCDDIWEKKVPGNCQYFFFSNWFILSILLFFLFPLLSKREIVWKRGQTSFMMLLYKFFIKLILIEMFSLRLICSVITDAMLGTLFICVQLPRFQKIRENPQEDSNLSWLEYF